MSFDVYLIPFAHQRASGVPFSAVHSAFGNGVQWDDDTSGWYGPINYCHIRLSLLEGNRDLISCVSVNRPISDQRFWASIYEIMRLGNVALFFPGGRPLIADPSVVAHLPEFEHLGQPVVVQSGSEIVEQIESS